MKMQVFNISFQTKPVYVGWSSCANQSGIWESVKGSFPLELAFETKSLRTLCENADEAKAKYGETIATVLRHRLADLRAASIIKDLIVGQPRLLNGYVMNDHMVVDLLDEYQLVFCANHPNNPVILITGHIDWSRVKRIKILGIEKKYV